MAGAEVHGETPAEAFAGIEAEPATNLADAPDGPVLDVAPPGPAEPRPPLRVAPSPAPRPVASRPWRSGPQAGSPSAQHMGEDGGQADGGPSAERVATAPQLRRFIKSRAYVPMHELRRRFAINGGEDDVTPVDLDRSRIYVGLPEREGRLLGELLRGGDIGYELSLDPISPIVVGVYPMRPVSRG
jgi:hypothetical protein